MLTLNLIQEKMRNLKEWAFDGSFIVKEFMFDDPRKSFDFANKIREIAEKQGHYPDIIISRCIVRISLTTHSERGLTSKDFEVAEEIDKI